MHKHTHTHHFVNTALQWHYRVWPLLLYLPDLEPFSSVSGALKKVLFYNTGLENRFLTLYLLVGHFFLPTQHFFSC